VCHRIDYEAEAAMRFEGAARDALDDCGSGYRFGWTGGSPTLLIDPRPVVRAAAHDVLAGVPVALIAARFHRAVAHLVVRTATELRGRTRLNEVALSGGVFLNALVTTLCVRGLTEADFGVLRHRLVPPSDAGLALGQLIVAARDDPED
jgi:hydrogenase maturation protein HypF